MNEFYVPNTFLTDLISNKNETDLNCFVAARFEMKVVRVARQDFYLSGEKWELCID